MSYELSIYELGSFLQEINEKYTMSILVKRQLSGGFITLTGEAKIQYIPSHNQSLKGNNIIGLEVKNSSDGFVDLKITGVKDSKFKVDIAPTKYREINKGGLSLNNVKNSNEDCKVRIDDDLIFSIPAPYTIISDLLKNDEDEICPICEDKMIVFDYAYDQNQYGKHYYKCSTCGHKMNTIK